MKKFASFVILLMGIAGCSQRDKSQDKTSTAPGSAQTSTLSSSYQRFIFPPRPAPFTESSVALDTKTGQLCKTFDWKDNPEIPSGLPLCSAALERSALAFIGATRVFRGYTYVFDGTSWDRKSEARVYNASTGKLEPDNADPYDPLSLFTKEQKAKRLLTQGQIIRVAEDFGVSYEEASKEAEDQGYRVPISPPITGDKSP